MANRSLIRPCGATFPLGGRQSVAAGPGIPQGLRIEGASLFDVTPTALGRFGLHVDGLAGRDLFAAS